MPTTSKSPVVLVKSSLVIDDEGRVDSDILRQMLEAGIETFSGEPDATDYLRTLLDGSEAVGLKVNTIGGPKMSTHIELADALSELLSNAGIAQKRHIIWDRYDDELDKAGFPLRTRGDGYRCFGTDHTGVGYDTDLASRGEVGGLLSRILTDYCESIVNIPVLKDHGVAGITGALKNHYGTIHNPNKYHLNGCNPYIADLNNLEQIKSKQRLVVMDALKVQFHGGPGYRKQWAADYGAVLISNDPVAIDSIGYDIIENLRAKAGLESIRGSRREPIYIQTAADSGLGNNDIAKIDLREISV